MSKHKKRSSNSKFAYQTLEVRKLLASVSFDAGTLTIGGSQEVDNISITENADGQTEVKLNDRESEFFASDSLQSIRIFSQQGNDDVVFRRESDFQTKLTNLQTVFVSAGEGNDLFQFTIPGTSADVVAIGDRGNDNFSADIFSYVAGTPSTNSFSFYGNEGDDVLRGGGGDDLLSGQAGDDRIDGSNGDDLLYGGGGNDILSGDDGVDRLFGGDGNDILEAGSLFSNVSTEGTEFLVGGDGDDRINGGHSVDLILGGAGRDILKGNGGDDVIFGGDDRDQIHGGQGDDFLVGQNGNDKIFGEQGTDRLYGNAGRDNLQGGSDADEIFGGADDDSIFGEQGADLLYGGDGDDSISGGDGNDIIAGHGGDDRIDAGAGDDKVFGGEGGDIISGFLGSDILAGQGGNDILSGQQGSDLILGGDGDDRIEGGRGFDRVAGNAGVDTFVYPESDRITDFDVEAELKTTTPYLDRYLGLTLAAATELAASSGLLTFPATDLDDISFTTNSDKIVIGVITRVGHAAYTPHLSSYLGSNLNEAIETAASYGMEIGTFSISDGESYPLIELDNPLRFLTANNRVLAVDGPRGVFDRFRLLVGTEDHLYLGLTRSEATILAEANKDDPAFVIIDGQRSDETGFGPYFKLQDGLVVEASSIRGSLT